jgi:enoyl-CoA hydratase/carnithine racemase
LREDHAGVARITLNRPEQLNALTRGLLVALEATLAELAGDPSVRVVVLAGAGRAFCAGHDLREMREECPPPEIESLLGTCARVMRSLTELPQPVIARVHGVATAAGCQLVAACDLAIASTAARFATSGIDAGLFCATPAVPISRSIGRKRALEMLLTGEFIDADTALQWGLVNRVVAPDALDRALGALCATLLAKPAAVLASGKRFFYRQLELDMADAYTEAVKLLAAHALAEEGREGMRAFLDKRAPHWPR